MVVSRLYSVRSTDRAEFTIDFYFVCTDGCYAVYRVKADKDTIIEQYACGYTMQQVPKADSEMLKEASAMTVQQVADKWGFDLAKPRDVSDPNTR